MGACAGSQTSKNKIKKFPSSNKFPIPNDGMVCGICEMDFELKTRCPMMICSNQHNICSLCLQKLGSKRITCPFCRQQTNKSLIQKNRILVSILREGISSTILPKQQTNEQKLARILGEAHALGIQKVIYHMESGQDLRKIKELHLWNLKLKKMIDFSIFQDLRVLDLHKNQIQKIQGLIGANQLRFLNIGYNKIKEIQGLESLSKLQMLDLCHNQISHIKNASSLVKLHTMNLNDNSITIIQNLYMLPNLAILYIKNNPIDLKNSKGSMDALTTRGVIIDLL